MVALPDPQGIRAILLDIEGTTTPVDFVYGVLFPFAGSHIEEFLRQHIESDEMSAAVEALRRARAAEPAKIAGLPSWSEASLEARVVSAAAYIRWLMDRDSKFGTLKSLQGRIWEAGYRSGELRGQVYPDVPPAFERWNRQGRKIAIFSSGSILAQKLLFANSSAGDLASCLCAFFDTSIGPKREPESYRRIAGELGLQPEGILFVSDTMAELDAARAAGIETALCVRGPRPGSVSGEAGAHPTVTSFADIFP